MRRSRSRTSPPGGRQALTKTHETREVAIPKTIKEQLDGEIAQRPAKRRQPDSLVFPGDRGQPLRHNNFYRRHFKPAARKIGRPELRFHDLRHTCASLLIAEGTNPGFIQKQLGHRNIATTIDIYGSLFPGAHETVAETLEAILDRGSSGVFALAEQTAKS